MRAQVKTTEAAIRAGNRGLVAGAAPIASFISRPCLNSCVWWRGGIWMVDRGVECGRDLDGEEAGPIYVASL